MTTTIHKVVEVGADGNLVVPLGPEEAGKKVQITISPHKGQKMVSEMTREEYVEFVNSFAGKWVGDFVEPEDLPPEKREEF
jgi:hypothetical protein